MRKSYGCEHCKIPSALADPYDNKQQKSSNRVFSFPYRDKHFAQKRAAPIPAFYLYYLLSSSTCLSLKFGNEERRRMMLHSPFLAVAGAGKGSLYNPSHHTPFGYEVFGANSETSLECSIWPKSQSVPYVLLHNGGGWPHTCAPGITEQCWARTPRV